jgi:hypothetical protein
LATRLGGKSAGVNAQERNGGPHEGDLEADRRAWRARRRRAERPTGQRLRLPGKRKEPLTDAKHVRNAIARFNQVEDVTDAEREQAFANLKRAASHYDVDLSESNWRELGKPS